MFRNYNKLFKSSYGFFRNKRGYNSTSMQMPIVGFGGDGGGGGNTGITIIFLCGLYVIYKKNVKPK